MSDSRNSNYSSHVLNIRYKLSYLRDIYKFVLNNIYLDKYHSSKSALEKKYRECQIMHYHLFIDQKELGLPDIERDYIGIRSRLQSAETIWRQDGPLTSKLLNTLAKEHDNQADVLLSLDRTLNFQLYPKNNSDLLPEFEEPDMTQASYAHLFHLRHMLGIICIDNYFFVLQMFDETLNKLHEDKLLVSDQYNALNHLLLNLRHQCNQGLTLYHEHLVSDAFFSMNYEEMKLLYNYTLSLFKSFITSIFELTGQSKQLSLAHCHILRLYMQLPGI